LKRKRDAIKDGDGEGATNRVDESLINDYLTVLRRFVGNDPNTHTCDVID